MKGLNIQSYKVPDDCVGHGLCNRVWSDIWESRSSCAAPGANVGDGRFLSRMVGSFGSILPSVTVSRESSFTPTAPPAFLMKEWESRLQWSSIIQSWAHPCPPSFQLHPFLLSSSPIFPLPFPRVSKPCHPHCPSDWPRSSPSSPALPRHPQC